MIFEEVIVLSTPFPEAVQQVKEAFAAEGFGTLTEIDLQATLKKKVDKDMPQHVIIGACNPHLASRAIDAMPEIGVLLPCNVVVRERGDEVVVEAMDPGLMATISGSADITAIADEARRLVGNALNRLQTVTPA